MPPPTLSRHLTFAAVGCFAFYEIVSVLQFSPHWPSMSGAEQFATAKHLLVVAGIAALLYFRPKIGSLCAVAWGAVVPLERYRSLSNEIISGSLFQTQTFAPLDAVRVLLLLLATVLSGILAYLIYARNSNEPASATRPDA